MNRSAIQLAVAHLLLIGALTQAALADTPTSEPSTTAAASPPPSSAITVDPKVAALIAQLGDKLYTTRDEAQKQLIILGPPALPALKSAAKSDDLEQANRATRAIWQIEKDHKLSRWDVLMNAMPQPSSHGWKSRIVGRAVNDKGKPAANVQVTAKSSAMGRDLWPAFKAETKTDTQGRFELPVPFGDIRYQIVAGDMGMIHLSEPVDVIPDLGQEVELALIKPYHLNTVAGAVTDGSAAPLAETMVDLIGEYGLKAQTKTDKEGQSRLTDVPDISQAVVVVRSGEWVTPLAITRINEKTAAVNLQLQKGATIEGAVTDQFNHQPIENATVFIFPWFANDFRMSAMTDEKGKYKITGIPSGKYHVMVASDTHFLKPPRGGTPIDLPEETLAPGAKRTVDLAMKPMAILRGQVFGPDGKPAGGAVVGTLGDWNGSWGKHAIWTQADRDGWFAVATAHIEETISLSAFTSAGGLATVQVPVGLPGSVDESLTPRLAGAARVRGVIADPQKNPINGVVCLAESMVEMSHKSAADGSFDLGMIPLIPPPRTGPIRLQFRAPRPIRGNGYGTTYSYDSEHREIKNLAQAPTFYLNHAVQLQAEHGKAYDLKIALEPTPLLEFTGRVNRPDGEPAVEAKVHLFTGEATEENWNLTRPAMDEWRGGRMNVVRVTEIGAAVTDKSGRWTLWVVQENGVGTPMGNSATDWSRYCVGVEAGGTERAWLSDLKVPDDTHRLELKVDLKPATATPTAKGE